MSGCPHKKRTRKSKSIDNIDNRASVLKATSTSQASRSAKFGVLTFVVVLVQGRRIINKFLQWPVARCAGGTVCDTVVATKGTESVRESSFSCLNEGIWLNDELINFFTKIIVQPLAPDIHCFSSYFFQTLLNEKEANPRYNFNSMRDDGGTVTSREG